MTELPVNASIESYPVESSARSETYRVNAPDSRFRDAPPWDVRPRPNTERPWPRSQTSARDRHRDRVESRPPDRVKPDTSPIERENRPGGGERPVDADFGP